MVVQSFPLQLHVSLLKLLYCPLYLDNHLERTFVLFIKYPTTFFDWRCAIRLSTDLKRSSCAPVHNSVDVKRPSCAPADN